jgi:hypothetical protein
MIGSSQSCCNLNTLPQKWFRVSASHQNIAEIVGGHRQYPPIHRKKWQVLQFGRSPAANLPALSGWDHEIATAGFQSAARL